MTRINPGAEIPAHYHTHADETVFVLEGHFIEDEILSTGKLLYQPPRPLLWLRPQDNPTGLSGLPKIITHPRSVKRKTVARNPRIVKRAQPFWEGKKFGAARAKPRGRLFLR